MRQTSIFDSLPKYKIDKPIRLIELFSESSLNHLSGDSIVVDVLMAIFGEMI